MDKLFTTKSIEEHFVIFAVSGKTTDIELSLDELTLLVRTIGGNVVGRLVQNVEHIHPAYYLGSGKLQELRELCEQSGATGCICDDELSPAQYKNMENVLEIKIIDRTTLILDIFALNANSAESYAQIELAQLNYRLTRLTGLGKSLSRLGGGIGTRGPGEKQLETDRRHIRTRIGALNRELKEIETRRFVLRNKREKSSLPIVSLVGYTNAGKSTIMNLLTNADVLACNKLFATLDTTTRKVKTDMGMFLLSDTVGFIQKLPPKLIKSFRATLMELEYADIFIHVVDASSNDTAAQMETVYDTLKSLNLMGKPIITVYNKMDCHRDAHLFDERADNIVTLSALMGEGTDKLLHAIEEQIKRMKTEVNVLIPYDKGSLLNTLHTTSEIIKTEYLENGIHVIARVPHDYLGKVREYEL